MKVDKNLLIVAVLVILVVISAVQSFQLIGIKSKVTDIKASGMKTTSSSTTSSSSGSSGSGGVPTNLQNLPGMVGGC